MFEEASGQELRLLRVRVVPAESRRGEDGDRAIRLLRPVDQGAGPSAHAGATTQGVPPHAGVLFPEQCPPQVCRELVWRAAHPKAKKTSLAPQQSAATSLTIRTIAIKKPKRS